MIKLVIHCADIHIRLNQRLEEYTVQMEKFVEKCTEICSEYERDEVRIVICGDLLHSKNTISPTLITMASFFIRKLEEIATVIVIAGNHDLIVENKSRTDAITSIFDTANFSNAIFLDAELGYTSSCMVDDNVVWVLYSIYDDFARPDNLDENLEAHKGKRFIGLFHGQIIGSTLNNGYVCDMGLDGDAFKGCDSVMCGHLHKRQTLTRNGVNIVYPSSLIQQNYGETVSQHGFAVWDLEKMSCEFHDIDNDYSLYKVEIDDISDINEDKERLLNL